MRLPAKMWLRLLLCDILLNISISVALSSASSESDLVQPEFDNFIYNQNKRVMYSFNGLEKFESIPVLFPKDICLFQIEETKYAACLHLNEKGKQYFKVFKSINKEYIKIYEQPAPLAISMDCTSFEDKGYVSLSHNVTKPIEVVYEGSPLYQVYNSQVTIIQYFSQANMSSVQFRTHGEELLLFQTITTDKLSCPVYKWTGYHFNQLDNIPCAHAKKMEPFWIGSNTFIAVANYADDNGNTETYSEIYKFDDNQGKFILFQKIRTSAAVDVKYFNVLIDTYKAQHFLVVANAKQGSSKNQSLEANSVIYKYEQGHFVPFQKLLLYAVQQFLPVQSGLGKFIMLIACDNQPTKLLHFNGWKFVESGVQLTEGSLGKGVSTMRVYEDENATYIIIANENMILNETNIYLPLYKEQKNTRNIKSEILKWSEEAYKNLSKTDVKSLRDEIKEISKSKRNLYDNKNSITLENVAIKEVVTKLLNYPPRNISSNFWKTIILVTKVLNNFEQRIEKLKSVQSKFKTPVENVMDEILLRDDERTPIEQRNQFKEVKNQDYESLSVGNLIVREQLLANKVNNQSKDHIKINKIDSEKIILRGELISREEKEASEIPLLKDTHNNAMFVKNTYDSITAEEIQVKSNINGVSLETINAFALKKSGNQQIRAPININNLKANTITINGLINDNIPDSKLVLINEGNFVVNQNISFSQPIKANKVFVNEKLNHVNVFRGELDVLLTSSEKTQTLTGEKHFEAVNILEPITISGKIFGPNLEKMSPISSVHDELILQGDYIISGDVSVKTLFSSQNIFGSSKTKSVLKVFEEAVEKQFPLPMEINFQAPVKIDHSIIPSANGKDFGQFVKTNTNEMQIIKGDKVFKGDLIVKGLCEAAELNGVNIENLEKITLHKLGSQNITGKLHFHKIIAPEIKSDRTIIGENDFKNILTTSTEQKIYGTVKINKLYANKAEIQEFVTSSNIMSVDFVNILQDTVGSNPSHSLYGENIFNGNVNVNNLIVKKTINNQPIESIEQLLSQLEGNIEFPNNIHFSENVNVANITFTGNFNGIPENEFGQCWLLSELSQKFTAPQTIITLTTEDDLILSGTINNYPIEHLINQTYWINRPEYMNNAVFESNVTLHAPFIAEGYVNGMDFTNEVLLSRANYQQEINAAVCQENVNVEGQIQHINKLNNLNLELLKEFLSDNISAITVNYAIFEKQPIINRLNSYNLNDLRNQVWLVNENVVLDGHISFNEAQFDGHRMVLQGLVNEVDLKSLAQNYFSLSRPQTITTQLVFEDVVVMENVFSTKNMWLNGPIKDITREFSMDFEHFITNSFTKATDQNITAKWKIFNVAVSGNLNNVLINDYNLVDDVMRIDRELNNITASKFIDSATIDSLFCSSQSKVSELDMVEWLSKSVLLHGNYTIQGNTEIDKSLFYNDIKVFGTVNNITFDEQNLFLKNKDQDIHGNVYIINKLPEIKQIFSLSFQSIYTNYINDMNMNEFFKNLATMANVSTDGGIIFDWPLSTKVLNANGKLYDLDTYEFFSKLNSNSAMKKAQDMLGHLKDITTLVEQNYKERKAYLSHFEEKQTILGFIRKILPLTLHLEYGSTEIIAVLSGIDSIHLTFYKWDVHKQMFVLDNHDISWYSNGQAIIDIFSLSFQDSDFLVTETFDKGMYYQNVIISSTKGLKKIFQLQSNLSRKIASIRLNGESCFIMYSKYNPYISTFCVVKTNNTLNVVDGKALYIDHAKQIIALEENYIIVLLTKSIEIRYPELGNVPYQVIPIENAMHVTTAKFEDNIYLAICAKGRFNSLHFGSIELYRSRNYSKFKHIQSIEVTIPLQAEFSIISETSDLLLYVLTNNPAKPLLVYEFQGVIGFKQRIKSSAAPIGSAINVVNLKSSNQHLVSVITNSGATFIESVLVNI